MSIATTRRLCRVSALAGGTMAIVIGAPALAEEASAPSSPQTVTEVLVTAEKREARLLDVPAPVTAVVASTLTRQAATRLDDYAALVPGLNLSGAQPGNQTVVLRGISTGNSNSTTTAVYINDTPVGGSSAQSFDSSGLDIDPGTLQRIEVLRGPQGTLYGANALGGILKYVTTTPSLTHYSGRFEVDGAWVDGGGSGGAIRGMIDGPLVKDKLGFTLSGFKRVDPGFIDNPGLGKNVNRTNTYGVRLALEWRPTDRMTLSGSVQTQDSKSEGTPEALVGLDLKPISGRYQQAFYTPTPQKLSTTLYSGSATYDFGWAEGVSITSYEHHSRKSLDDVTDLYGPLIGIPTPPIGLNFTNDPVLSKFTQELRLASKGAGRLEWQAGFYFTHEHGGVTQAVDTFNVLTQEPIDAVTLFGDKLFFGKVSAKYTEYAGYADVTYHFTHQFQVQVGIRESYNRQSHVFPSEGLLAGGALTVTGGSSDTSFTYLVTPKYTFDDNSMIYARIASGYRPGGPNNGLAALTGLPTTFGPDTLTNYEVGYKASLLDHTATLDVSAFDIEWRNIQILETVAGISQTGNGAAARSYGFEGSASWRPVRGLSLFATLALTKAYLTENAPGVNGKAGDRLPYSPKVGATLSADYQFPLTGSLDGFLGATFRYVGDRDPDFQSSAPAGYVRPRLAAYHTFDLRAGVQHEGVEFDVFVKNLNNSGGLTNLRSGAIDGVSLPLYAAVVQPRTVGVALIAKF
jgi:iron complex outermembrane recepter protein